MTIITFYTYKNNKPSFVTGALVPIKLPFVTQNTRIYISEMKNCDLVSPKNFRNFSLLLFWSGHHFLNLQQGHLKFCHQKLWYWQNYDLLCKYINAFTHAHRIEKMVTYWHQKIFANSKDFSAYCSAHWAMYLWQPHLKFIRHFFLWCQ